MLYATFLRSPFAHARITAMDVTEARVSDGVIAVFTGADIAAMTAPVGDILAIPGLLPLEGLKTPVFHALATDKVRFVGDPLAVVVANSRAQAEDAAELILIDYEPLDAIASAVDAFDQVLPRLFEDLDSNVTYHVTQTHGDVDAAFRAADRVITQSFTQHRQANVPMETRGSVVSYDPDRDELTYYTATQVPHLVRYLLAELIDHPADRLRVICGDVGGAFGLKGYVHREDVALAAIGKRVGRPVKWIEDRNEHLMASGQARQEQVHVAVAVTNDGTVLGLRAKLVMDQGAYPAFPFPAAIFTGMIGLLLPGPYRLRGFSFDATVVATNKCSYVAYRGPWEVETWVRERMLDLIARELGLDPADLRRRNVVAGAESDRLITGPSLAEVSSRRSLERALDVAGYGRLRAEQQQARAAGRYRGIGFATFIEAAPGPPELRGDPFGQEEASVRLEPDGKLSVITAQSPHGQGHETTLAQVAADEMGVPFEDVRVLYGDTDITPFSAIGTGASRASTWASGAVLYATRKLKDKALELASELLKISPLSLEISDGVVAPCGLTGKSISLRELARTAQGPTGTSVSEPDTVLEASELYTGTGISGSGWSGGTHLCVVDVDLETGFVRILRWIAVVDCGRLINPAVVEGQIRGGIAQGIAGVLYEHSVYDNGGQPLATSFMDYLVPTSAEIPDIEIDHIETESAGEVSFRGVGEGGAIVAPAALTNAIEDALAPLGVRITEQYLPPSRLLELAGIIPAHEPGG
jgi:carbon-monoxide dehydrogenase large subunit